LDFTLAGLPPEGFCFLLLDDPRLGFFVPLAFFEEVFEGFFEGVFLEDFEGVFLEAFEEDLPDFLPEFF
jgi:hypothetical protein